MAATTQPARSAPPSAGVRDLAPGAIPAPPADPRPCGPVALAAALSGVPAPLHAVDLGALEQNAHALVARAGGLPIRLASKSVRCAALIRHVLDHVPGFRGVLAYTPAEALHLVAHGVDDLLVAYPTVDAAALRAVAARAREDPSTTIRLLVDDPAHVDRVADAAVALGVELPVCLEVDVGWWPLGGRLARIGPKRSPIREPAQAAALAVHVARTDGVRLAAVMAYEGHVAGVGDVVPGRPLRALAIRGMQAASLREIAGRLPRVLAATRDALAAAGAPPLELVDGGGTGSLDRTAAVGAVTELAAGSGLLAPTLFDRYRGLTLAPAAAFALPVVRRPGPGIATLLGGGDVATGAPGADRLPVPVLPAGLRLDRDEGAGEVQTPVRGDAADALRIGDRVWLRHAKAGEPLERADRVHLVRDGEPVGSAATYRGEGRTFL